jgi:hypothetical protein
MQSSAKAILSGTSQVGPQGPPGNTGVGATFAIVSGQVDFGCNSGSFGEDDNAFVTIAATGVTSNSKIICQVDCSTSTADHTTDDAVVECLTAYPQNLVAGVGFDVKVSAPFGTWGKYNVIAYIY